MGQPPMRGTTSEVTAALVATELANWVPMVRPSCDGELRATIMDDLPPIFPVPLSLGGREAA
jgi:hypothetical protein